MTDQSKNRIINFAILAIIALVTYTVGVIPGLILAIVVVATPPIAKALIRMSGRRTQNAVERGVRKD